MERMIINNALAQYGAKLTSDNYVQKGEKVTGIQVERKGQRLNFQDLNGTKYFSGPIKRETVEKFVETFWFWRKV